MSLILALTMLGCTSDDGDDTSQDTSPVVVDDTGEVDSGPYAVTLSGVVRVELYDLDSSGERIEVDESALSFPFGAIWVAASDGEGEIHGSDTVRTPSFAGDAYSVDVELDEEGEITLYAQLDYWADGILGSSEPVGVYPTQVTISSSDNVGDLDITILAYYDADGSDGGGGGGCSSTPTLSGDLLITRSYAGGDAVAMLMGTDGSGPWNSQWVTPATAGSGASAAYSFSSCTSGGTYQLVGAWDSDGDELITPADTWGAYISEPDVDGNPIVIGSSGLSGYDIQVPLGDGDSPFGAFPFVTVSGDVSVQGGTFSDYPAGTSVYVAALKYRPQGDLSVAELTEMAYGVTEYEWSELQSVPSVSYSMTVPAGTIVYLWAYADANQDGSVNGPGEPVASAGGSTGKLPTGSEDTVADMQLGAYSPPE